MLNAKIRELDIPVVEVVDSFSDIDSFIEHTRSLKGMEGYITSFNDGHKVKSKADEYVRIHKALDRIRFDRNIVDLIINEELDDVISLMPDDEADRIRDFEENFWDAFLATELRLDLLSVKASELEDRKAVATKFIPTLENKSDASFIFKILDGYDLRELMIEHMRKCLGSNVKWDECAKWMGMIK